jgi:Fic family protein
MQNEFVIYDNIQGYAEWSKEQRNAYMRDYRLKNRSEDMATRTENMKRVNANKNAKAKAKIRGVLTDIFVREQIHFKNGKIRIGEVAKLVNMTAETVSKHLKEMGR